MLDRDTGSQMTTSLRRVGGAAVLIVTDELNTAAVAEAPCRGTPTDPGAAW